jgi:ABC-type transport system involved in multi-copper enzyme maturation permease subunit
MLRFPKHFDLPLLSKELIEQAARKRTYVIRVAYATILFLMAILFFYQILSVASVSPLAALGQGKKILSVLVGLQFAGVYLFMPAMTCSVLTQEKERDSLQLLFLTRLGPWAILFEKLLGRLVPMLGFLLLSLPLVAFAYTLGGVSPKMMWSGVLMLVVASIQMGTLALMCSAFCRTTVGAFMSSYVLAFVMFFGPYFVFMLMMLVGVVLEIRPDEIIRGIFGASGQGIFFLVMFPFFGPPIYFLDSMAPGIFGVVAIAVHSAINLAVSGGFMLMARKFLVSRAFVPHRNLLLRAFKSFDRQQPKPVLAASEAGARGPVFSDDALLPADEPIVWRETKKRMLGSWRYILRVLLIIEAPVILFCGLLTAVEVYARRYDAEEIVVMLSAPMHFLMWVLAVLAVSVKSASLIAGERSHQTLDVLCTTPLKGRQIILEKMRSVRRMILVTAVPFSTVFLFKALRLAFSDDRMGWRRQGRHEFDPVVYLACQALALGILLPLVAWLSLLIGLKVRTQGRAIMGSMAAIVAWCIGPLVFIVIPLSIIYSDLLGQRENQLIVELATLLSPATVVFMNEIDQLKEYHMSAWGAIMVNFAIYGALLFWIRRVCLVRAERWLGRLEAEDATRDNVKEEAERGEKSDESEVLGAQSVV